ncbi:MAG: succinate dehydrogenase assembly factor 2 [Cardiobacteriaceae bacterium]|nr:succinate dehydrogenase assembly factor 2 [Cardiobacteriaceae bacterium]
MNAKLAWLSRRGIKELDIVLQSYLHTDYPNATPAQQQAFARLLEYQDPDILDRLFHGINDQDPNIAALIEYLRTHHSYN